MVRPATIAAQTVFAAFALGALACGGSDLVLPSGGTPAEITIVSGDDQSGAPGTLLSDSIVVRVRDSAGEPVAGQTVEFVPDAPGASVTPATSTTNAEGLAGARWVLGTTSGSQIVVARLVDEGAPSGLQVRFTATASPGAVAAPSLVIRTQPSSSARRGEPFETQPGIQLRDADGDDLGIQGVAVTAAVASGSGTLQGTTTRVSDSNGRVAFNDLAIDGSGPHTLIFAAAGYTSVVSVSINVSASGAQAVATRTRITEHEPDPSRVGQAILVRFTVSSDAGAPPGEVVVTASGGNESCTASVATGSCSLTLSITGRRELLASYRGSEGFRPSSDRANHRVESAGVNQAPTAVSDEYNTIEGFDHTLVVGAGSGVLDNDRDPEGSPLRASEASDPPHGTVNLSSDGSFSYTPEPDFYGDDHFTYRATDEAGNSSTAQVTIHVAPVNDSPSFGDAGDPPPVSPTAGPQRVRDWARNINPGPNEADQTVEFLVTDNTNPGLFAPGGQPAVDPSGPGRRESDLTYTPSGQTGTATITIRPRDNGGTANGGADTGRSHTFTIRIQ